MLPFQTLPVQDLAAAHAEVAHLLSPRPSLLADLLQARLESESRELPPVSLPSGVRSDLRPQLPRIGMKSLMLYAHRRKVDNYPLIYTTLALAHPN